MYSHSQKVGKSNDLKVFRWQENQMT